MQIGASLASDFKIKEQITKKKNEEKQIMNNLKNELIQARKDLKLHEENQKNVEGECSFLTKKLKLFKKIKSKLYYKIFKHGLDCR